MDIALITEGTYPAAHGGVSVWCDQLIRGLGDHRFDVHAITGTHADRPVWSFPANVRRVELLPLWGGSSLHRRLPRRDKQRFAEIHDQLVRILTGPEPTLTEFIDCLHELWLVSDTIDVTAGFRSEDTIQRLLDAWQATVEGEHGSRRHRPDRPRPTIADAVNATSLLDHCLRPLAVTPRDVDVTHSAANGLGALLAFTAKWAHGTPFILTEHGVYLRERYLAYRKSTYSRPVKDLILRFFKLLTDAAYLHADLITPGNTYNQRWARRGGADPTQIRTVYNGVDPSEFPIAGPEPDIPTISFMGRIDPIKDIETLLRSFALVRRRIPAARLRIFGSAGSGGEAYLERCQALAAELGITGSTTFEGRVEHARSAYAAGNVVALTSVSEGFPYTVVEAMMSGRATVSTDVGGVGEAVGDTGLLVPPRDPERFAAACVHLLTCTERRRELAVAARTRATSLFTLDSFLEVYDEIYTEVGSRRRAAGPIVLDDGPASRPIPIPLRFPVVSLAEVGW
jgi:polysaccharide biosynthesis protein PelF